MTIFADFITTRTWSNDLATDLPASDFAFTPKSRGYIYLGHFVIEQVQDHWPDNARMEGEWYLVIGNQEQITDDLEKLEHDLHDWAVSSGY